jgi:hypothetical protein
MISNYKRERKKNLPGLFNGALTAMEYLLSAGELPDDRETKLLNGLVPLVEDLLVLVKLENAEK